MRLKAPAFTRRPTIIGLAVALVVVGGVGTWALTRPSSSETLAPTMVSATTSTIRQSVSATGTVEPAQRADLSFVVSGTVTSVPVAVGDKVKVGTTLARVDSASLKTALTLAEAKVAATEDQLSAQDDAADSAVQIASTQSQLVDAQGKLTEAKAALAAASLTSTVAGTVATVTIATGDQVAGVSSASPSSATAGDASSTAQIVVISTTSWVVQASVGSADLPRLKKGLQAEITPTGSATKVFGTVKSVGIVASSSSSGSGGFPVTIAVTGSPKGLYAGGAATATIIVKQIENVLTVPTGSLHTEGGKTVVHQVTDGVQASRPVIVGTAYGAVTQILSGLSTGDKVVVTTTRGANNPGGAGTRPEGGPGGGDTGRGGLGGGGFGGGGLDGPPPGAGGAGQ